MTDFCQMTYSQQRMVLGGLLGQRVLLTLMDGREMSVEPVSLCTPVGLDGKDARFESSLAVSDYHSPTDLMIVRLRDIRSTLRQERYPTDPKHPDYCPLPSHSYNLAGLCSACGRPSDDLQADRERQP
jgi:hypothetical protein